MATGKTDAELETKKKEGFYLRLHLLVVKYGTPVLRARFNHSVPQAQLHQTLQTSIGIVNYAKSKNIISRKQYSLLYPPYAPPTSEDFDVSLLVYLLRYMCGLNRKSKWWREQDNSKIPVTEICEEADIVRIRNIRNETQHSQKASLDETDFGDKWDIVEKAMIRLGTTSGMQSLPQDITIIKTESLDIIKEKITYTLQSSYYDDDPFWDDQDDYDRYDDLQDDYDRFIDDQDDNDRYVDTHDDYDRFIDDQDDYDRYDYLQDDNGRSIYDQDDYDRYDDLQDDYGRSIDDQDDNDRYVDSHDDFDRFIGDLDNYDRYDDLRDDYDRFIDDQDYYDRYDYLQDDNGRSFHDQDDYDRYDDLQDDYDRFIGDQDDYGRYDESQHDYDDFFNKQENNFFYNDDNFNNKSAKCCVKCQGKSTNLHVFREMSNEWRVTKSEDVIFLMTCIIAVMAVVVMILITIIIVISDSNMKQDS